MHEEKRCKKKRPPFLYEKKSVEPKETACRKSYLEKLKIKSCTNKPSPVGEGGSRKADG